MLRLPPPWEGLGLTAESYFRGERRRGERAGENRPGSIQGLAKPSRAHSQPCADPFPAGLTQWGLLFSVPVPAFCRIRDRCSRRRVGFRRCKWGRCQEAQPSSEQLGCFRHLPRDCESRGVTSGQASIVALHWGAVISWTLVGRPHVVARGDRTPLP